MDTDAPSSPEDSADGQQVAGATRRQAMLALFGTGVSAGLAGCGDLLGRTPDTGTGSPSTGATATESATRSVESGTPPKFEPTTLRPESGDKEDRFGYRVAIDGDRLVVGAPEDEGDPEATPTVDGTGAAFVFERTSDGWRQDAILHPTDPPEPETFGKAVAVADGTILVGDPGVALEGHRYAGVVSAFQRTGGAWSRTAVLEPREPSDYLSFGSSIAFDGATTVVGCSDGMVVSDWEGEGWSQGRWLEQSPRTSPSIAGDTILLGAPGEAVDGTDGAGAVHVHQRDGGTYQQTGRITPADPKPSGAFGLGISLDGDTALVGAPGWSDEDVDTPGSAMLFERDGEDWSRGARFERSTDGFGGEVALDGRLALVADPRTENGSVTVLWRTADGWTEHQQLTQPGASPTRLFGFDIALADETAAVGHHYDDENGKRAGAATVYR